MLQVGFGKYAVGPWQWYTYATLPSPTEVKDELGTGDVYIELLEVTDPAEVIYEPRAKGFQLGELRLSLDKEGARRSRTGW